MVRATAEHQDVLEALGVESMRLGLDQWRFSAGRPRLDVRFLRSDGQTRHGRRRAPGSGVGIRFGTQLLRVGFVRTHSVYVTDWADWFSDRNFQPLAWTFGRRTFLPGENR